MVTSREALHLGMERDYPVALLSVPNPSLLPELEVLKTYPSIALFIQRAQCRKPSFELMKENARDIVEVCNYLDGLPLAIELFASYITLFSPSELKECFVRQSYTLSRDPSVGSERHQSLHNNIKWSYDLLDTHEQWFLRQFSVFVGGATLKTIEGVLATEEYSAQCILDCANSARQQGPPK